VQKSPDFTKTGGDPKIENIGTGPKAVHQPKNTFIRRSPVTCREDFILSPRTSSWPLRHETCPPRSRSGPPKTRFLDPYFKFPEFRKLGFWVLSSGAQMVDIMSVITIYCSKLSSPMINDASFQVLTMSVIVELVRPQIFRSTSLRRLVRPQLTLWQFDRIPS